MGKTHWKKLNNPDYLGAYALDPGNDLIATIQHVQREVVTGPEGKKEECTVVHFRERDTKPLILNVTNAKTIQKLTGTPYIEDWRGQKIQLYIAQVKAFGDVVDALRIRPKAPVEQKPELKPDSNKWANTVDRLRSGEADMDTVKKYFDLTPENEALLLANVAHKEEEQECLDLDT